jgi:methyl-accepting chemotaxis protein
MRSFSIDPNRLDAVTRSSDDLHAAYRELSQQQQDLSDRLQRQRVARDERLRGMGIAETQIDSAGNRVPRDPLPEDRTIIELSAKLQVVRDRMSQVSAEASYAGRLATAAREHAESNERRVPRYGRLLGVL